MMAVVSIAPCFMLKGLPYSNTLRILIITGVSCPSHSHRWCERQGTLAGLPLRPRPHATSPATSS